MIALSFYVAFRIVQFDSRRQRGRGHCVRESWRGKGAFGGVLVNVNDL